MNLREFVRMLSEVRDWNSHAPFLPVEARTHFMDKNLHFEVDSVEVRSGKLVIEMVVSGVTEEVTEGQWKR